jgi:hypothetical protein
MKYATGDNKRGRKIATIRIPYDSVAMSKYSPQIY